MKKFIKFKSKKELLNKYGIDWRYNIFGEDLNWIDSMDYLLGEYVAIELSKYDGMYCKNVDIELFTIPSDLSHTGHWIIPSTSFCDTILLYKSRKIKIQI